METTSQSGLKSFSLKNRHNWSDSRYAWFYAFLILIAVVIFAIILKIAGIYESMSWRIVNMFFIIVGLILLVIDYRKHKNSKVTYTQAALLCARCGFYFALLFLPALAFVISGYPHETDIIKKEEVYNSHMPTFEIVFINYVEVVGSVLIGSILASYFSNIGNKSNQKQS